MTELKKYSSATAFRKALEERLKQISRREGMDLQRLRRQVAFDRLLARLFNNEDSPWALKGGYAMELRIAGARTTKDIDLTMLDMRLFTSHSTGEHKQAILDALQDATSTNLSDYFIFLISQPVLDLDGAPYIGVRYPVEVRIDGRSFVKFHLDVGVGDVIMEPFEITEGRDWLNFMGIANPHFRMISKEQQFAEKLHAYTLPRVGAPNSRVKDLVDMVLLLKLGTMDKNRLKLAIQSTFARRKTHPFPQSLSDPPREWEKPFAAFARECKIVDDLAAAFIALKSFVLSKELPE